MGSNINKLEFEDVTYLLNRIENMEVKMNEFDQQLRLVNDKITEQDEEIGIVKKSYRNFENRLEELNYKYRDSAMNYLKIFGLVCLFTIIIIYLI